MSDALSNFRMISATARQFAASEYVASSEKSRCRFVQEAAADGGRAAAMLNVLRMTHLPTCCDACGLIALLPQSECLAGEFKCRICSGIGRVVPGCTYSADDSKLFADLSQAVSDANLSSAGAQQLALYSQRASASHTEPMVVLLELVHRLPSLRRLFLGDDSQDPPSVSDAGDHPDRGSVDETLGHYCNRSNADSRTGRGQTLTSRRVLFKSASNERHDAIKSSCKKAGLRAIRGLAPRRLRAPPHSDC